MEENRGTPLMPHQKTDLSSSDKVDFLWKFIEEVPAGLFMNDANTLETIWINKTAAEIVGLTKEERYGYGVEYVKQQYHPDDMLALKEATEVLLKEDGPIDSVIRVKHSNGEWLWLYSIVKVLRRNSDGTPHLLAGAGFNMTKPMYNEPRLLNLLRENQKLRSQIRVCQLSKREKQIIELIAKGMADKKIADVLFVSTNTVRTHRKNIYRKLELKNAADATRFASECGII